MGEEIRTLSIWRGVSTQNVERICTVQQKDQQPNQKMSKGPIMRSYYNIICLSPKKTYRWLTDEWKKKSLTQLHKFTQPHLLLRNYKWKCGKYPSHSWNWPVSECLGRTDTEEGRGEKGPLIQCWWDYTLVQPQWKTSWRFLQRLKKWKLRLSAVPVEVLTWKS